MQISAKFRFTMKWIGEKTSTMLCDELMIWAREKGFDLGSKAHITKLYAGHSQMWTRKKATSVCVCVRVRVCSDHEKGKR